MALRLLNPSLAGARHRFFTRPASLKSLALGGASHEPNSPSLPLDTDDIIDHIGPTGVSKEHYPEGWEYGHHPDDYKMLPAHLKPEFFFNPRPEQFPLFHRISFKIGDDKFLPMSFVVHSGAPASLYLSDKAFCLLQKHKRIETGFRMRFQNGLTVGMTDTPRDRQPFNIIGMGLIAEFGLQAGPTAFWKNGLEYW
ncbi:hypothetical protein B0H19DRAFT_590773 [Mycena capillaripes]|nr:hypothetical protein B0H19DRAFT_590773 [Mycena capillaripes]